MPQRLVLFVEGDGDKAAVPALARRVVAATGANDALFVDALEPFEVHGLGTLVKNDCAKWRDWLTAAGRTRKNVGAVLLLLDADLPAVPRTWTRYVDRYKSTAFCAYRVAAMLAEEARAARAGEAFSLAVAFAVSEFEAWTLAGVESLRGVSLAEGRGSVPPTVVAPTFDIEAKRDAKRELIRLVPGYSPSLDQAVLAAKVDLTAVAARCRSFRRFVSAIEQLAGAVRSGKAMVSPAV